MHKPVRIIMHPDSIAKFERAVTETAFRFKPA